MSGDGTSPGTGPRPRTAVAVTLALVAVTVALRLWTALSPWGLGQDACSFLLTAKDLLDGRIGADLWPLRMKHPAYPLLIAGGGALGADLEWTARVLSIGASAGLTALVHRVWSRWRGPREGLVAGALFALHPALSLFGGEIWTEPLQMLALFAGMTAAARIWETASPARTAAWIGAAFGFAACLKNNAAFFVPGAAVAALMHAPRGRRIRSCVLPAAAFLAAFVPLTFGSFAVEYMLRGSISTLGPGDTRMMEEADQWAVAASADAPGRTAAFVRSASIRLVRDGLPWLVWPFWIVVPAVIAGCIAVRRAGGAARRFATICGLSVALEWCAMLFFGVQERYLVFAQLWLLPMAAAGGTALGERARSLGRWGRALPWAAAVVLAGFWMRSFVATTLANRANVNGYRSAGLALREVARPPRRLLTTTAAAAWHAGADRAAFAVSTWADVDAAMTRLSCDGLVVGSKETGLCPDLAEVRALAPGSTWRGLTVIVRIEGEDPVSVLAR